MGNDLQKLKYAANIALAYMAGRQKNNLQHIVTQLRFHQTNNAEQQNKR
jgi:hypothetical protein